MRQLQRIIFGLIISLLVVPIQAQGLPSDAIIATPALVNTADGGAAVTIKMVIKKPYHVNANPASDAFLIPTQLTVQPAPGLTISKTIYPNPKMVSFAFTEGKQIAVYADAITITVPVKLTSKFVQSTINCELKYQACDEKSCYAPQTTPFRVAVTAATTQSTGAREGSDGVSQADRLSALLSTKRLGTAIPLIFLLGLLLNLTPCVYPIIPITIAFFSRQSARGTAKQLGLSGTYVLGMAIMYAILGTAAALLGKTFGFQLQNPWVVGGFAAVLVVLSLSMFGLYEIQMPAGWRNKSKLRDGYLGALTMGLLVGIAAAPCVGPVVVALATAVSATGSVATGFGLFFVLGLGLGFPYLILGAFSSKIKSLPRSGDWMIAIERIFGLMLLATAAFLVQPILPKSLGWTLPTVIAACGLYLMLFDRHATQLKGFTLFKRILGFCAVAGAVIMLKPASPAAERPAWPQFTTHAVQQATSQKRPIVLDFYADWCIPCKELDARTFSDPQVQSELTRMAPLKVDLTRDDNTITQKLKTRYAIKGVPTIVFIDGDGHERKELRLTGFEPANQFIIRLQKLSRSNNE